MENPRDHTVIIGRIWNRKIEYGIDGVATILVSKEPFPDTDLDILEDVRDRLGFEIILSSKT